MERSFVIWFNDEAEDYPDTQVQENIALTATLVDFSEMSVQTALGDATIHFHDDMKNFYENWQCGVENCTGLYLSMLSVSKY